MTAKKVKVVARPLHENYERILTEPRITEKAALAGENNVYTFNVPVDTNKIQIKKAVQALYGVTPRKVAIIRIQARKVITRRSRGVQSGYKKALVTLSAGESIEF